jgi:glutamyl-tRNA synthetase
MTERKRIILIRRISTAFDLNRVHKSGAKFDPEKINGSTQYLIKQEDATLAKPSIF